MSQAAYSYPHRMGRIILQALEEVAGAKGVQDVLAAASPASRSDFEAGDEANRPIPFESVSQLHVGMETVYGTRGGRGLALRTGRASFSYGLRAYGSALGLSELAFRLLPLHTKLHAGARMFADLFNKYTDQRVRLEEGGPVLLWHIERCPLCWGRQSSEPICHMAVGLLQESLYWLSGGKIFNVEETRCIAGGDPACTIAIGLTPLS
jgi:predicted hydrocarbon binding protein